MTTDMSLAERLVADQLHALADIPVTRQDVERAHGQLRVRLDGLPARSPRLTRTIVWAAAAVVVALIAAAALGASTEQPPVPAGKVIAHNPFLTNANLSRMSMVRTPSGPQHRLSRCVDPHEWHAQSSRVATFQEPARPNEYVLEYLLDYATPAAAHRALMDAWHQIHHCPTPGRRRDRGQFFPPGPVASRRGYDEGFALLQSNYDTSYFPWYGLRVARVGNVLVVLESTGVPVRVAKPLLLTRAVNKALPAARPSTS